MILHLPWPPSMNRYWRSAAGRVLLSRDGRDYRAIVAEIVNRRDLPTLTGRLTVQIHARMPDHRRRDLDNLLKATLDALQHGGLYEDDAQIDELTIRRGGVFAGGELIVAVSENQVRPDTPSA
jgi:crossover junction endodeoxyribonuclease RusA